MEYARPVFHGNDGEVFRLLIFRVTTALRGKELISSNTDKHVEAKINENALSLIVRSYEENPRRVTQKCIKAIKAWENFKKDTRGKL